MLSTRCLLVILALPGALALGACDSGGAPAQEPVAARAEPAGQPAPDEVMDECPGSKPAGHTCGDAPAAEAKDGHFGAPFTKADSEPLSAVASRLGDGAETVQVRGTVESVCQKAGCWMVLEDGDVRARIFTKGHGFFLPKDIAGRQARVEGELKARTLSEKFAKHLEQDKGGDPSKIQGQQRELVMDATAVALLPSS